MVTCPRCGGVVNPTGFCPECRDVVVDVPPVAPAPADPATEQAPAGSSDQTGPSDQAAAPAAGATGDTLTREQAATLEAALAELVAEVHAAATAAATRADELERRIVALEAKLAGEAQS